MRKNDVLPQLLHLHETADLHRLLPARPYRVIGAFPKPARRVLLLPWSEAINGRATEWANSPVGYARNDRLFIRHGVHIRLFSMPPSGEGARAGSLQSAHHRKTLSIPSTLNLT